MNKPTRKRIAAIMERLEKCKEELEEIRDDEEAKFDNLTENLQQTKNGTDLDTARERLDESISSIEESLEPLQLIISE